jgi:drug/metabolite transporter (DMT)-like permease
MVAAGVMLLVIAGVHGDATRVGWSEVSAEGWLALLYLIGPGSVLAFTAYGYALAHLPLSTVSTYAYVNPVVAVVLGVALLGEALTTSEVVGTVLIVASVVVTLRRRRPTPDARELAPLPAHDVPARG